MQGSRNDGHQACLRGHWGQTLSKGVDVDLSQILLKVMALYGQVSELEKRITDLLNEVQLNIKTDANAKEITIDDPDG
tara:strand:+ start:312 stop:545 length:234 start_codon:yes stop_codon:yes gene_type:complete